MLEPGDGKGVVFPGFETGETQIGVLAGSDGDVPWEVHRHSAGLAGHGLDRRGGITPRRPVGIGEADDAGEALGAPEDEDGEDPGDLGETAVDGGGDTVDPGADEGNEGEDYVGVEKGLVKGVADGRKGEDEDDEHGDDADSSRADETVVEDLVLDTLPAVVGYLDDSPGDEVDEDLEDGHATHPSVEEVVGVEADVEKANKGVVATGKDDQGDHVDDGEGS